jgi:hypothetical protein
MQTLKTIVATAVITLAATTVAVAGVGKVNGQNPTAPTPVPAVAAHQQQTQAGYTLRLTDAQAKQLASALSTKVKTERKHERHAVRHLSDVKHAHAGRHAYASAGHDAAHDGTQTHATSQARAQVGSGDQTCDQTRQRSHDQTCGQTRDHVGSDSGDCGGGPAPYTVLTRIPRVVEEDPPSEVHGGKRTGADSRPADRRPSSLPQGL